MATVAGKPEFVAAWKQARGEAITKEKILRGWESTGIFPRDRSKPLKSRLTKQADALTPGKPERAKTPDQSAALTGIDLQTPTNSRQLKELESRVLAADGAQQTVARRLGFRKLQKAFDSLSAKVVEQEHQIKQLKGALER